MADIKNVIIEIESMLIGEINKMKMCGICHYYEATDSYDGICYYLQLNPKIKSRDVNRSNTCDGWEICAKK
jgi:hypothetical protein